MPFRPRKQIIDLITASGSATEAEIVTECTANGVDPERVGKILERLLRRGVLSKTDDGYSLV